MNARERAEDVHIRLQRNSVEARQIGIIERAIIAAEEAKVREERVVWLNFLDREAKGFQVLIDHAPTEIRAEDLKRVKHCIENLAELIKAQSEGEKKGE